MVKVYTNSDTDLGIYISETLDGDLTTVSIYHDAYGLVGRGHARRDVADTYNEAYGRALATTRALSRLSRKIEKVLVKNGGAVVRGY